MKSVGIFALTVFGVLGATGGLAQALDVDWKFYGGAKIDGISHYCFYDANGVVKQPDTRVRVWTKCLSEKDIDESDADKEPNIKILDIAAQKIDRVYIPPIIAANKVDFGKIAEVAVSEEIANICNIQPVTKISYELDCSQMMLRVLSMEFQVKGKTGSTNKPSDWKYFPPEGNGATLSRILCPLR